MPNHNFFLNSNVFKTVTFQFQIIINEKKKCDLQIGTVFKESNEAGQGAVIRDGSDNPYQRKLFFPKPWLKWRPWQQGELLFLPRKLIFSPSFLREIAR